MVEYNEVDDKFIPSASVLDKTDWRVTIHRKLEACIDAEGTVYYPCRVKSLISCVCTKFPGWDAKDDIQDKITSLEVYYNKKWDDWLENNLLKGRWQKYNVERAFLMKLYKDIFEYIKDTLGAKRMLLYGVRHTPGGTPIDGSE